VVGDTTGRGKATVCRIVTSVTDSLVRVSRQLISWPTRQRKTDTASGFNILAGFPNVIGAMDGPHVRIIKPGEGVDYINRKNYPSINVMAVCDHKGINLSQFMVILLSNS